MTDEQMEGQVSISDLGIWCGKTCSEPSALMGGKTSESFSKRPLRLPTVIPQFLDYRKERLGLMQVAFWETDGLSLGGYTPQSFGVSPRDAIESHLSQILEERPLPKYCLSEKACQGILRRAKERGKELPKSLEEALKQSAFKSEQVKTGGVKEYSSKETESELSRHSIIKQSSKKVYGISPYDSNSMKSDNPLSGIYEADSARTLDLNGANPNCNQGGMIVIENKTFPSVSYDEYIEDSTSATLKAAGGVYGGGQRVLGNTVGTLCSVDYKCGQQIIDDRKVVINYERRKDT